MRRRDVLGLIGGIAAWPAQALAQDRSIPVIGFLSAGSPDGNGKRLAAFMKGLESAGLFEGQHFTIDYRWAMGRNDSLPELAADLVRRQVALIVTPGSTSAAVVAKAATSSIPIVFSAGSDPVALGLVSSLNKPGGNATGITSLNSELAAKRLGLFRELTPRVTRLFTLVKPSSDLAAPALRDLDSATKAAGLAIEVLKAETVEEIDAAFASIPSGHGCGMIFGPEGFFFVQRERLARRALERGLPTIFDVRDYVEAGGLASYGSDYYNVMELTGGYAARVLKGQKPDELPIQQASKFEFLVNRRTAAALGLEIAPHLLATADEVIE